MRGRGGHAHAPTQRAGHASNTQATRKQHASNTQATRKLNNRLPSRVRMYISPPPYTYTLFLLLLNSHNTQYNAYHSNITLIYCYCCYCNRIYPLANKYIIITIIMTSSSEDYALSQDQIQFFEKNGCIFISPIHLFYLYYRFS